MLIYGNTPDDIKKMIVKRRYKLLTIIVVIAVAVMLMGCTIGSKKVNPPLQALDMIWKKLGSGEKETDKIQSTVE
jgi:hypothetical protein|tara:strand:+ start:163 stop:387 length:225 start_codon:yes stop_codon:yes gene_type:complete